MYEMNSTLDGVSGKLDIEGKISDTEIETVQN